jgi:hypothetical protein
MMSFHEKHPKKGGRSVGTRHSALGVEAAGQDRVGPRCIKLDHKHLRNSVLSFFEFVTEKMRPHLELARAGAPSGLVKVEPKRSASSPAEASGTGRQRQIRPTGQASGEETPRGQKLWTKASRPDGAEGVIRRSRYTRRSFWKPRHKQLLCHTQT